MAKNKPPNKTKTKKPKKDKRSEMEKIMQRIGPAWKEFDRIIKKPGYIDGLL